ncbi:retrotransposon protein, putative, ty1-copia subclass [Tanacetum coccineum]
MGNLTAFAPKPKIPPPPKREDPAKDSICHECGETGHWKRNCPQYLAELLKKKKNAASGAGGGSGIFVIELNTFLNRSWIYDTGCGTHICNTNGRVEGQSRKLKPGALLVRGNGQREAVEQWQLDLSLLALIIVLNNCHDLHLSLEIYPMDGIFEIDFSNSYANKSSIYTVSNKRAKLDLDSALLWHCRLGHISKKRIEKICLLVSITKHEVFETFKVFQKEVENQLGKTIKSLRSDRGGEYMSQELFGHLKDHGIIAHRTPPYTPQHNGVSERRNRTLLDMVRSMMSQTTLPKSFWDYALETTFARILNMVPTKKVKKTPYESTRTRRPTDRMCLYINAEEHELGDLERQRSLDLVNSSKGKTVVAKRLFKKKTDNGWSYIRAIRILIAIKPRAAYYDYEIWQMDVKTAFLNGYLYEEVYMEQPEGEAAYILGNQDAIEIDHTVDWLCQML